MQGRDLWLSKSQLDDAAPANSTYLHTQAPAPRILLTCRTHECRVDHHHCSTLLLPATGRAAFCPFTTAFAPALVPALPREPEQKHKPKHWSQLSSNELLQPAPLAPVLQITTKILYLWSHLYLLLIVLGLHVGREEL